MIYYTPLYIPNPVPIQRVFRLGAADLYNNQLETLLLN